VVYYGIAAPILFIVTRVFLGVRTVGRIEGKRNLKGAVIVCNHVHKLDCALVALALFPRRPIFPTLPKTIDTPVLGFFVRLLGGVPTPRNLSEMKPFFDKMAQSVTKGRIVHFFPEGDLVSYDTTIRKFHKGAFLLAARTQVPIIPIAIEFRPPKGIYKIFRSKPVMLVKIGEPIPPTAADVREDMRIRPDKVWEFFVAIFQNTTY